MMYQRRFINYSKSTIQMSDTDNGGGYASMGAKVYGKPLYISLIFSMELKTD